MNPIKKKLAGIIVGAAEKEVENLKNEPGLASEFKRPDIKKALSEDVERLLENLSFAEGARIMSIIVQIDSAHGEKAVKLGKELSAAAESIIKRTEAASGPLNFSKSCRKMYLKFGG